jgi:hypothetical protein
MKINPNKGKALRFTRARLKDPLNYSLRDQKTPNANGCKYLAIIIRSIINVSSSGKLHGSKRLDGITFGNAYGKKGIKHKTFSL